MEVQTNHLRTYMELTVEKEIFDLCNQVRQAIVRIKHGTYAFKSFPYGCCRDASIVLGEYLKEMGYKNINLCFKDFEDESSSHVWLELSGFLIDITADQFGNNIPNVLILSSDSSYWFHKKSNQELSSFSIAGWDSYNIFNDYNLIKVEISTFTGSVTNEENE